MRVVAAILLLSLLPLAAVAQVPADASMGDDASQASTASAAAQYESSGQWVLPAWRTRSGGLLVLSGTRDEGLVSATTGLPMQSAWAPWSSFQSANLRWSPLGNVYTRLGVQHAEFHDATSACVEGLPCSNASDWNGAQVGGGYRFSGFSVDIGASWLNHAGNQHNLPMVLPESDSAFSGVLGIPGQWVDSLGGLSASGSMHVGEAGRIDVGASVGRLRMLPGNEAGLEGIDQRALSFGIGTGPVSGTLVGRVMQPVGTGTDLMGLARRWSAVDLGVTVRFPWEGELSVGAQNLWSSGRAALPVAPAEPVQGRVPYIQYHQEL